MKPNSLLINKSTQSYLHTHVSESEIYTGMYIVSHCNLLKPNTWMYTKVSV